MDLKPNAWVASEIVIVGSNMPVNEFPSFDSKDRRIGARFLINALTAVGALMTLIDITLSNARRFYWSMGNPLAVKGLTTSKTISSLTLYCRRRTHDIYRFYSV